MAELRPDSLEIVRRCPWCGENGVIRGWGQTLWDRPASARRAEFIVVATTGDNRLEHEAVM